MDNPQPSIEQEVVMTNSSPSRSNLFSMIMVSIFMLLIGLGGGYILFANKTKTNVALPSQQTQILPTIMQSAISPTKSVSAEQMKTYKTDDFTVDYPSNWITYIYPDNKSCVTLSDISNPQDIPSKIAPTGHQLVQLCHSNIAMPESFPYMNGSNKNVTIKPFNISGYSGIRGKQTSSIGEVDTVYLDNPGWGHIEIQLQTGDEKIFSQILSSFKFTHKFSEGNPQ